MVRSGRLETRIAVAFVVSLSPCGRRCVASRSFCLRHSQQSAPHNSLNIPNARCLQARQVLVFRVTVPYASVPFAIPTTARPSPLSPTADTLSVSFQCSPRMDHPASIRQAQGSAISPSKHRPFEILKELRNTQEPAHRLAPERVCIAVLECTLRISWNAAIPDTPTVQSTFQCMK